MRRSRKKKKSWGLFLLLAFVVIASISVLAVYSHFKNYNEAYQPTNTEYVSITINPGSSTTHIAKTLESDGIIKSARTFKLKARFTKLDGKFQAGDYQLSPCMGMEELMELLQDGHKEAVSFTIPEGYTLVEVAKKLVSDGLLATEDEFYDALEDEYKYWFVPEHVTQEDPTGTLNGLQNRLEGFLLPETYQIYVGSSAHQIIDRMLRGFNSAFPEEWKTRITALKNDGYPVKDVEDIITIASMIERETRVADERAVVSSVIYNRLKIGMKLQLDATVQYALGEHKDRVLYSDLEIDSKYNTYKYEGIPCGPICSPGKASIEAALYPDVTEYYYYVLKSDNSGAHNFARNMNEFSQYNKEYKDSIK